MAIAAYTYFYGPSPQTVPLPSFLTGQIDIGVRTVPTYRAFIILIGAVLIALLIFGPHILAMK